jgi:hypothetical protein
VGFVDVKDQVATDPEMAIGSISPGSSTHAAYFKKGQTCLFVNSVPNAKAANATLEEFSQDMIDGVKAHLGSDVLHMKSELGSNRVTFSLRARSDGEVRTYVQRYYFFHGGPHAIQVAIGMVGIPDESQLRDFWQRVTCLFLPPPPTTTTPQARGVLAATPITVALPGNPLSLAFTPSGKYLIASSTRITQVPDVVRAVTIVDATTGSKVFEQDLSREMPASPWMCAVDAACTKIAYRKGYGIVIYDIAAREILYNLPITTKKSFVKKMFGPLQFTSDGTKLLGGVSSYDEGEICVWSVSSGLQETSLRGHDSDPICCLATSCQGDGRIASASEFREIILWDLNRLVEITRLTTPLQYIRCLTLSADGRRVAAAGEVYDVQLKKRLVEVQIWDTREHSMVCSYRGDGADVLGLQFSPDRKQLASATATSIILLNAESGDVLKNTQIDPVGHKATTCAHAEDLARIAVGFPGKNSFEPGNVIIFPLLGGGVPAIDGSGPQGQSVPVAP